MTLEEIRAKAAPICTRYRVRGLRLFGSYARGENRPGSDLDFCVSFEELPPSEYARQFFGLLHDLEDTFHSAVDLLTDSSIRKESLRKSLQRDGVQVYG
jgi:predicted nucleotidyltransferase